MTTYIVTFEVNAPTRKSNLVAKLQQFNGYCPIHENCWAVLSDKPLADIYYFLNEVIDSTDRIFIIRSGTHAVWRNDYGDKNIEWLKERL